MKSIEFLIFILFLFNFVFPKEEKENQKGLLYEIGIGPNSTKIKMLLSTFTTNNSLYSNSNRKYSKEIQQKRNGSTMTESIFFNKEVIPEFTFDLKMDPTDFKDSQIQGEFGLGIDLKEKIN